MHHQQKGSTPPPPALAAPQGPASVWAGDWPALGESRGAQGHYEGVTASTRPALGLPHLCPCHTSSDPPRPLHVPSIPVSPGPMAPAPVTHSLLRLCLTGTCCPPPCPTPAFPEGHPVWPRPLGLPPHPPRSSTHPYKLWPVSSPEGGAPRPPTQSPPLGLVSPRRGGPGPQGSAPSPPAPVGHRGGLPPQAAKHDFGKSF